MPETLGYVAVDNDEEIAKEESTAKKVCCGCLKCVLVLLVILFLLGFASALSGPAVPPLPAFLISSLAGKYAQRLPEVPAANVTQSCFHKEAENTPGTPHAHYTSLKPKTELPTELPKPDIVFDKVIARREFLPEPFGFNLLHATFVNFFLEDFFRTLKHTNGSWVNRGTSLLSQIYGTDEQRVAALRSHQSGKMKVDSSGKSLPAWKDIVKDHPGHHLNCGHSPFAPSGAACLENSSAWLACGDSRCNQHPGFLFWATAFVLHHNAICDMLVAEYPSMTDDDLFETARKINQWAMFKMVWEDYIFLMTCAKDLCTVPFEPELTEMLKPTQLKYDDPNIGFRGMWLEFNQLYHWHHWIPESIQMKGYDNEANGALYYKHLLWNPDKFLEHDLQAWAEAFAATPMGHIAAQNYPVWMKDVFLKFLNYARRNGLQGYNDFREFIHLPRLTQFEEFGASQEVIENLKMLYNNNVDLVDFQVGLFVDGTTDPKYDALGLIHPLALAMKTMVGTFAVTSILNTPLFDDDPKFLSSETLTERGLKYAREVNLAVFVETLQLKNLGKEPNLLPGSWRPNLLVRWFAHWAIGLLRALGF